MMTGKMSDSKYFNTQKKGEIYELKAELNSDKKEKKKEAVKKVIASMTVGKDVSALFTDVTMCMQTDNLELKKLVYLYLINYAKTQPDLAILAVNTFVKDCEDPNPLIRALAVRTMGCIRVEKITEYLCEPLRKCLKDEDPYVRKTAAVCVAKLHDISAARVEDQGFLETLGELLCDSNPMVVANAVAAISEILDTNPNAAKQVNVDTPTVNKLLTALNECTEWGQIFILDSLNNYSPRDEKECISICERITPRLAHANAAVVLSAVKVLMKLMDQIANTEFVQMLQKKLAPPLVTLLSAEAEIQYVALRNINLVVQKRPDILKHEIKAFFVKYNDPIYVKLEKLDIMIRLAAQSNIAQVLAELKEYATEVDVDFVRKAVRAIGRCAIKVEPSAEKCVTTLLELIQTKVNYVVQEAIVVIKDIFRKYPNKYETIISTLCENLDSLDEPEARAAMIWIVGEYAERIDNADEILQSFLDGFHDENTQVQLQLLTAIVKLFLKKPQETQELVQKVLSLATQDSDNPDLRDRGYIYWRLLSTDPAAAKEVVLAEKPLISEETDLIEPTLLDELICHISSLASVYHKPPSAFVEGRVPVRKIQVNRNAEGAAEADHHIEEDDRTYNEVEETGAPQEEVGGGDLLIGDLLSLDYPAPTPAAQPVNNNTNQQQPVADLLGDIFGGMDLGGGAAAVAAPTSSPMDLFSLSAPTNYVAPQQVVLPAARAKGLEVSATFARRNKGIFMDLTLANKTMMGMSGFAVQFNKNSFGLAPGAPLSVNCPVLPNVSAPTSLSIVTTGPVMKMEPLLKVQIAVKNDIDVFYFECVVPAYVLFVEEGSMERNLFPQMWREIPDEKEKQFSLPFTNKSQEQVEQTLTANNVFVVATRQGGDGEHLIYTSVKFTNGIWVLGELRLAAGAAPSLALKTHTVAAIPEVHSAICTILAN